MAIRSRVLWMGRCLHVRLPRPTRAAQKTRRVLPGLGLLVSAVAVLLVLAACSSSETSGSASSRAETSGSASSPDTQASRAPAPDTVAGLSRIARTDGERMVLQLAGGEVDFITGVNVGPTVPGTQPGELAVSPEVWRRWLPMIAEAGFHSIRIYTVQPPHFYEELKAYNDAHPDHPIYLVHGVWIPEEQFVAAGDLFAPGIREEFHDDIAGAVGAIHGDAVLPPRAGYASGTYTADVSPWLISWALGIEMDPVATMKSDRRNAGRAPYSGRYVSATAAASPTESWLAEGLDVLAGLEAERGITVPLTFSNWPTTDPLAHPSEPLPKEDLVGIDANHLTVSNWPGGYYASYHAYPYYPDFQRYEPGIADFEHEGRIDPYAGYLTSLREHHAGMPVVVLEYGVPSSIGSAHDGPLGRDQGGHDEHDAMAINAELMRLQRDVGIDGGFVFEWADEWFKFTWNTIDYELPTDRRQLWHNPLTNESVFGLLAIEDAGGPGITIDGDGGEWDGAPAQVIHESKGRVREVRAAKDAGYLYLRILVDKAGAWRRSPLTIGFDVAPGGGGGLPNAKGVAPDSDTAVVVSGDEARAYVRASNDPNALLYGRKLEFFEVDGASLTPGSAVWNEQRLITNKPYVVPTTREARPPEWFDLNPLLRGNSDPAHPAFDRRTVWAASGKTLELRIPHLVVGFSDPSSRSALVVRRNGVVTTAPVERIGITVALGAKAVATRGYSWDKWNRVEWLERPKAGYEELAQTVREISRPAPR